MATNQGDSTSSTPYTGEDAQDALKRIIGTKKEDTTDYSTDSGENEDSVTQTPDDVLDTSIGVREGIIKSINPNATNGFYYKVYFEGTNTSVDAKLTYGLGFSYTPEGEWENDIYYVSEKVKVKLQSIKDTLQWIIIGIEEETPIIIPGSAAITRGNSQIEVNTDYTTITNINSIINVTDNEITVMKDDMVLKIDKDWVYVDGKKICVEPCEGSEPATVLWYAPNRAIIFSCDSYVYVYDLDNEEFVGEIALSDVTYIYEQSKELNLDVIKFPDSYYTINFSTGTISTYQKYRDKSFSKIFQYYITDENGNLYNPDEWVDLDTEPFFNASEYNFGDIVYIGGGLSDIFSFYEKGILYLYWSGYVDPIVRAQIYIDDIVGEKGTSEVITSAYTIYEPTIIIITTTNKLITLSLVDDTFIILRRESVNNTFINKTYEQLVGYWGMTRFYLLKDNKDIYYLSNPTLDEPILPRLEYVTSFDEEIIDLLFINDYHLGSFQVSTFYGRNGDSIYYIKSDNYDFIDAEKGSITKNCEVNTYGILWKMHDPI